MDQAVESLILSQITSDISITYKEDGTFVNYTCDTKLTLQQFNKNNDAIIQKCIEKITQLFADNQSRGRIESQILETLRTVSTDNDRDDPKQVVTTLLLGMDAKSSNDFENVSIKMRNCSRNAAVSIRFSY
ncbi:hypothetical protein N9V13_03125 [Betaproteobacteria bacterium]|nr:hypothetical protein [Betaproteobacteria bacterium]